MSEGKSLLLIITVAINRALVRLGAISDTVILPSPVAEIPYPTVASEKVDRLQNYCQCKSSTHQIAAIRRLVF